jgi:LmbE family N-acetylglucosaminyl deacetylase
VNLTKFATCLLSLSLLPVGVPGQASQKSFVRVSAATPETAEQTAARKLALQQILQRLMTTGRIMQVVAHPDDEDGAMLTLESRVKGNTAELFTFTRGEGGQNAQGAVFFDELGILRTLELLAADKEYGAEERFSHLADFGFSKTAAETYAKWGGREVPLEDLVRAVREFQPDVLVARFSGTPRDGHGHHQASAQLTVQAFSAAADRKLVPPERFVSGKKTIKLQPWQPEKLYTGLAGDTATLVPDETQPSPLLDGKTPQQVALEGLRHQLSQGAGNWKGPMPKIYSSYKLVATADGVPKADHEADFFDGVDTSLPALTQRFPEEAKTYGDLRATLMHVASLVGTAQQAVAYDTQTAVQPITEALRLMDGVLAVPQPAGPLRLRLEEKQRQLQAALRLAAGIAVELQRVGPSPGAFVHPGEVVDLQLRVTNHGAQSLSLTRSMLEELDQVDTYSHSAIAGVPEKLDAGETVDIQFQHRVSSAAIVTRAYFHRESPVRDTVYQTERDLDAFQEEALSKLPVFGAVLMQVNAVELPIRVAAQAGASDIFVAPPVSVTANPQTLLLRLSAAKSASMRVQVRNTGSTPLDGTLSLEVPQQWTTTPKSCRLALRSKSSSEAGLSALWPVHTSQSEARSIARFSTGAISYSEGYHLLSRTDLPDSFPYYAPAQTTISLIDADIPEKNRIGYIMGAGDTIPDDLTSLGFTVHLLSPEDLATGDLSRYDTIVTGVRAYGSRPDLREHNLRLLDYVKSGGTMVVQYEQDVDGFNKGNYTPYPVAMGRERVSQEEQPVKILNPKSEVFHYPNHITQADFDNWVQERGLYFAKQWSSDYTPLLEMNDAGEAPLDGGLLMASYGRGVYITTSLSFYRELPNGVPGATRLFINLLAAGHNAADQPVTDARR